MNDIAGCSSILRFVELAAQFDVDQGTADELFEVSPDFFFKLFFSF